MGNGILLVYLLLQEDTPLLSFLEKIERQCLLLPTCRHAEVDEEDLSEFLNDGSWKRGYNINRWDTIEVSGIPCRTYAIMM